MTTEGNGSHYGDRGSRPGGPRGGKPYGDRKGNGDRKPYGDKPRGGKPYADRKPYGDRKGGSKPYGDKPRSDRKQYGDKPYGDKPRGDRKFDGERDGRKGDRGYRGDGYKGGQGKGGYRKFDDKPRGDRKFDDLKGNGDRRSFDGKPRGGKPYGGKSRGGKPYGGKPYGDRKFDDRRDGRKGDRAFDGADARVEEFKPVMHGERDGFSCDRQFEPDRKPRGDRKFDDRKPRGDRRGGQRQDIPPRIPGTPYGSNLRGTVKPAVPRAPRPLKPRSASSPKPESTLPAPEFSIMVTDVLTGQDVSVAVHDEGSEQFASRLKKVAKERRKWASREDVSCYRVYDADLPDFAVAIDRYDGVWKSEGESYLCVAEYQAPGHIDQKKVAARFADIVAIAPIVLGVPAEHVFTKTRRREKGGGQYTDQQKTNFVVYTQETGNVLQVDLGGYLDTGIFLDHRVTREMVGEMAEGTNFLNLFSYTGTATVHAAVGGAKTTTTVDLSQTYLNWAKRNMELNGCTGPEHRFVRADVLQWLVAECETGHRYDLIFVDPPTFSNSKAMGRDTWSVQRDHVKLLTHVAELLAPDGKAVFSCNLRDFKPEIDELAAAGIQLEDITEKTIPHDFERNPKIHKCYIVTKSQVASTEDAPAGEDGHDCIND